jgi:predicted membrane channel-forming protein YqfA (hemolysin III family)
MGAVPQSLSETYYGLKDKGWMFPVFCVVEGLLVMISLLDRVGDTWYGFLAFLICIFAAFAGITYNYRDDKEDNRLHYTFAVMMAICVIVLNILNGRLLHLIGCLVPFGFASLIKKENTIFFMELALFVSIFVYLCT